MNHFMTELDSSDDPVSREAQQIMWNHAEPIKNFTARCNSCGSNNISICHAIRYESLNTNPVKWIPHTWVIIKCRNCKQQFKLFEYMG